MSHDIFFAGSFVARYSETISSLGNFGYITTYQMVTSRLPVMLLSIGKDHSYMELCLAFSNFPTNVRVSEFLAAGLMCRRQSSRCVVNCTRWVWNESVESGGPSTTVLFNYGVNPGGCFDLPEPLHCIFPRFFYLLLH
jgi:hypothetical protein